MNIVQPGGKFDFDSLTLAKPDPVQGGGFFSRLMWKNGDQLYVQLPPCNTKDGVVMPKRNHYIDLMYEKPFPEETMEWVENIEVFIREMIFSKRELWFSDELDESEIEQLMSSVIRIVHSGKNLQMRTFLDIDKSGRYKCKVFDEREIDTEITSISSDSQIIPIVSFDGVRIASKSFDIIVKLRQIMILDKAPDPMQTCMIRRRQITQESKCLATELPDTTQEVPLTTEVPDTAPNDPSITETPDTTQEVPLTTEVPDTALNDPLATEAPHMARSLEEVSLSPTDGEYVKIKNPNEIYYEVYQKLRGKAKKLREQALAAYLEANKIKMKCEFEDSDDEEEF